MGHLKSTVLKVTGIAMIFSSAQAKMIPLKTMESVQKKIESVLKTHKAEDILVAFDIDMTLIQPDHPAVSYSALKKYQDTFRLVFERLSPEQRDMVNTLIVRTIPQKRVEESTPQIVGNLQETGIKAIAFTATLTGKVSAYKDETIFFRYKQLQEAGIDFLKSSKGFPKCISFSDFPQYVGSYPMFCHGILSSNGERKISKGETLVAFLKHISCEQVRTSGYVPKVIILVDDRKKNLLDVEKNLKAYNPVIQFTGIEYQGAYSYAPHPVSREEFQSFWEGMAEKAVL